MFAPFVPTTTVTTRGNRLIASLDRTKTGLLPACSRLAWALWLDDSHRAAKMHVHFEVLRGIPVQVTVTAGVDSETVQLRETLTAGQLYVEDRKSVV